jgi:hypothetical protein
MDRGVALGSAVGGWQNRARPPPVQKSRQIRQRTPGRAKTPSSVASSAGLSRASRWSSTCRVDYDSKAGSGSSKCSIHATRRAPIRGNRPRRRARGRERRRENGQADGVPRQADPAARDQGAGPRAVGEPLCLWLARDTDGDLKADTKDLVRNDYGRLEGNPEHNANSLHWGLDNVIYTSEHTYHLQLNPKEDGKFDVIPTLSRGQWGVGSDDGGRIYRNWNEQPLFVDIIPARYFMRTHVVRPAALRHHDGSGRVVRCADARRQSRLTRRRLRRRTLTTYVSAARPPSIVATAPKDVWRRVPSPSRPHPCTG